jgi:hypothetical protein
MHDSELGGMTTYKVPNDLKDEEARELIKLLRTHARNFLDWGTMTRASGLNWIPGREACGQICFVQRARMSPCTLR